MKKHNSAPKQKAFIHRPSSPLLLSRWLGNSILLIELNDPHTANSFSPEMAEQLLQELKSHANQKIMRGLIVTGQGRFFCSGGNLQYYAALKTAVEGKRANRAIASVLEHIQNLGVPTACVINGDCWGGGVEVSSSFDRIYMVPEALIALWQGRIALSFGWGGYARLLRRMSEAKIKELVISGRSLSSYEAQKLGLVDQVVVAAQILHVAERDLQRQLQHEQIPVAALKSLSVKNQTRVFEKLWWSPSHQQVIRRKLKK